MSNPWSFGKWLDHQDSDLINGGVMFGGLLGGVGTEKQAWPEERGLWSRGRCILALASSSLSLCFLAPTEWKCCHPWHSAPPGCLNLSIQPTTGLEPLKHEPNNLPFLELICLNFCQKQEKKVNTRIENLHWWPLGTPGNPDKHWLWSRTRVDQLQIHKILKRYSRPNFVDEGFKSFCGLRALLRIRAMHINPGREGEGRAESKYCGA